VTSHEAWGLGIYSVFRHPNVVLDHAIETPRTPGVRFHHMVTVALDNLGVIDHIINDVGDAAIAEKRIPAKVTEFP
jgi:hypothetical protein